MAMTKGKTLVISREKLREIVARDIQELEQIFREEREKTGLQEQREEKPKWLM